MGGYRTSDWIGERVGTLPVWNVTWRHGGTCFAAVVDDFGNLQHVPLYGTTLYLCH